MEFEQLRLLVEQLPAMLWTTDEHLTVTAIGGAAYASHLVLDWLGADQFPPYGIELFWPFSDRWFSSGWCVFPGEERRHIFTVAAMVRNLTVLGWELGILGPVVVALWWLQHEPRE